MKGGEEKEESGVKEGGEEKEGGEKKDGCSETQKDGGKQKTKELANITTLDLHLQLPGVAQPLDVMVCVCVCVCVCACMCACTCVFVRACTCVCVISLNFPLAVITRHSARPTAVCCGSPRVLLSDMPLCASAGEEAG